jgi:hypothetical protein
MPHTRERHRPRAAQQLDLFGTGGSRLAERSHAWEALPAQARAKLTALMIHLIVEHARSRGAGAIGVACHEH